MLIIYVDLKSLSFQKQKSSQNYTFNTYSANKTHKTTKKNGQMTYITQLQRINGLPLPTHRT